MSSFDNCGGKDMAHRWPCRPPKDGPIRCVECGVRIFRADDIEALLIRVDELEAFAQREDAKLRSVVERLASLEYRGGRT